MGQPFAVASLAAPRHPSEIDAPAAPRASGPLGERRIARQEFHEMVRASAARPSIADVSLDLSEGSMDAFAPGS